MIAADTPVLTRLARSITALAVFAVATLPFGTLAAQESEEVTVSVTILGFSPQTVEITTGTTVVWENGNAFNYPVADGTHEVADADERFASPPIAPAASWGFRFLEPGTYDYADPRHSNLTGRVVVTGEPITDSKEASVDVVEPDPNVPDTWGYEPVDLVVDTGTTVTWRNTGATAHTVTDDGGAFDSGDMAAGDTFDFTFDEPGTYQYHCDPHPWMTATVRVAAEGEAPPPPPPPADSKTKGGSDVTFEVQQPTGPRTGPQTWQAKIVEPQMSQPKSWTFVPNKLDVRPGDTITWTNAGKIDHTVTADEGAFDSGNLGAGKTYSRTFTQTGVYRYSCTPHPWMTGVVVVSEQPVDVAGISVEAPGGLPEGISALGPPSTTDTSSPTEEEALPSSLLDHEAGTSALPKAIAIELMLLALATIFVAFVARPAPARDG